MSSCGTPPPNAPVLALTLVGAGEPAMRMERRLRCAAAGIGVALELELRKDPDALGLPYAETPAVLLGGRIVFTGLPRTEEIERRLRQLLLNEASSPLLENPPHDPP